MGEVVKQFLVTFLQHCIESKVGIKGPLRTSQMPEIQWFEGSSKSSKILIQWLCIVNLLYRRLKVGFSS